MRSFIYLSAILLFFSSCLRNQCKYYIPEGSLGGFAIIYGCKSGVRATTGERNYEFYFRNSRILTVKEGVLTGKSVVQYYTVSEGGVTTRIQSEQADVDNNAIVVRMYSHNTMSYYLASGKCAEINYDMFFIDSFRANESKERIINKDKEAGLFKDMIYSRLRQMIAEDAFYNGIVACDTY